MKAQGWLLARHTGKSTRTHGGVIITPSAAATTLIENRPFRQGRNEQRGQPYSDSQFELIDLPTGAKNPRIHGKRRPLPPCVE